MMDDDDDDDDGGDNRHRGHSQHHRRRRRIIIIGVSNHKNAKHDCSMCVFCLAVGRQTLLLCSGFRLVCEAHRHHYHRCLASSQRQRPDVQGLEPKVAPDFVWWSQLTNHTHNINISESTTQQRQTTAQHSGDEHQHNNR